MCCSKMLEAIRHYDANGWTMTPVNGKAPFRNGWQEESLGLEAVSTIVGENRCNVGVVLGEPSEWLVDIDLDHALAVELASEFLPPTQAIFGRDGKPSSHWFYVAIGAETHKRQLPKHGMIVELRATGCQTVLPPSKHPSGELIEWSSVGEPAVVDAAELRACVDRLADEVERRLGESPKKKPPPPPKREPTPDRQRIVDRCRAYVAVMPPAISGQGGHDATFNAACECFRFGLSDAEAESVLSEFNARCVPPWSEKELAHKLDDARNEVSGKCEFGCRLNEERPGWSGSQNGHKASTSGRADDTGVATDDKHLVHVCMNDVEAREVEWLWPNWLACGKITLLAGDPGFGKSTVSLNIAAVVSRGWQWPDQAVGCKPGKVLILSAEDGIEDTIKPRLESGQADCSKIHAIQGVAYSDDIPDRVFNIKCDTQLLVSAIEEIGDVKLVIIDPVASFLDGTDTNKNGDVRSAFQPLVECAERFSIAVLCVTHLSKAQARSALAASTGSLAFGALARQAHIVLPDPEDEARRLLLCMKSNICAKPSGLAFSLADGRLAWSSDRVDACPDAIMRALSKGKSTKLADATAWLVSLGLDKAPRPASEIKELAKQLGHSMPTVQRAFASLNGRAFRVGFQTPYLWTIPDEK